MIRPTSAQARPCSLPLMPDQTAKTEYQLAINIINLNSSATIRNAVDEACKSFLQIPAHQVLDRIFEQSFPWFNGVNGHLWLHLLLQHLPSQSAALLQYKKDIKGLADDPGDQQPAPLGLQLADMLCRLPAAASKSQLQELLLCLLQLATSRRCHLTVAEGAALALHVINSRCYPYNHSPTSHDHRVQLILAQPRSQELLQLATQHSSSIVSNAAIHVLMWGWLTSDLTTDAMAALPCHAAAIEQAADNVQHKVCPAASQYCWIAVQRASGAALLVAHVDKLVAAATARQPSPCQLFSLAAVCNIADQLLEQNNWRIPAHWPPFVQLWLTGERSGSPQQPAGSTALAAKYVLGKATTVLQCAMQAVGLHCRNTGNLHHATDMLQYALEALRSVGSNAQLASAAHHVLSVAVKRAPQTLVKPALELLEKRLQMQGQLQPASQQHTLLVQLLLSSAPDPVTYPDSAYGPDGCRMSPDVEAACRLWAALVALTPIAVVEAVAVQLTHTLESYSSRHRDSSVGHADCYGTAQASAVIMGADGNPSSLSTATTDACATGVNQQTEARQAAYLSCYLLSTKFVLPRSTYLQQLDVALWQRRITQLLPWKLARLMAQHGPMDDDDDDDDDEAAVPPAPATEDSVSAAVLQLLLQPALVGAADLSMMLVFEACQCSADHRQLLLHHVGDIVAVVSAGWMHQQQQYGDQAAAHHKALPLAVALLCKLAQHNQKAVAAALACSQLPGILQSWFSGTADSTSSAAAANKCYAAVQAPDAFAQPAVAACEAENAGVASAAAFLQHLLQNSTSKHAQYIAAALQHFADTAPVGLLAALLHDRSVSDRPASSSSSSTTLQLALQCMAQDCNQSEQLVCKFLKSAPAALLGRLIFTALDTASGCGTSSADSGSVSQAEVAVAMLVCMSNQLVTPTETAESAVLKSILPDPLIWDVLVAFTLQNHSRKLQQAANYLMLIMWQYMQQEVYTLMAASVPKLFGAVLQQGDAELIELLMYLYRAGKDGFGAKYMLPYTASMLAAVQPNKLQVVQKAAWSLLQQWARLYPGALAIIEHDGLPFLLDLIVQNNICSSDASSDLDNSLTAASPFQPNAALAPIDRTMHAQTAATEGCLPGYIDGAAKLAVSVVAELAKKAPAPDVLLTEASIKKLMLAALTPSSKLTANGNYAPSNNSDKTTTSSSSSISSVRDCSIQQHWDSSVALQALQILDDLLKEHQTVIAAAVLQNLGLLLAAIKQQQYPDIKSAAALLLLGVNLFDRASSGQYFCSHPQFIADLLANSRGSSCRSTVFAALTAASTVVECDEGCQLLSNQLCFDSLVTATQHEASHIAAHAMERTVVHLIAHICEGQSAVGEESTALAAAEDAQQQHGGQYAGILLGQQNSQQQEYRHADSGIDVSTGAPRSMAAATAEQVIIKDWHVLCLIKAAQRPNLAHAAIHALACIASSSNRQHPLLLLPYRAALQSAVQHFCSLLNIRWTRVYRLRPDEPDYADLVEPFTEIAQNIRSWVEEIEHRVHDAALKVHLTHYPAVWRGLQEAAVLFAGALRGASCSNDAGNSSSSERLHYYGSGSDVTGTDCNSRSHSSSSQHGHAVMLGGPTEGRHAVLVMDAQQQQQQHVRGALIELLKCSKRHQHLNHLVQQWELTATEV